MYSKSDKITDVAYHCTSVQLYSACDKRKGEIKLKLKGI